MNILATFTVPHPPLIVKEVGNGREKEIEKTKKSYEIIANEIGELKPDTIIIISPHAPLYSDCFYISKGERLNGSFAKFGASEVVFNEEVDTELEKEIVEIANDNKIIINEGNQLLDHGSMVPLYFIRQKYQNFKVIVLGFSFLSLITNYQMGKIVKKAIDKINRKVVVIASGDLSHKLKEYGPYGFEKEGPIYDEKIMDILSNKRFNELLDFYEDYLDLVAECGHRSFIMMSGILDGIDVKAKMYSHEDVTGVGYGICSFYPEKEDSNRLYYDKYLANEKEKVKSSDEYVNLAKETIINYIKNNKIIDIPNNIPTELINNKSGVFVSIHEFGRLRGCIGTICSTKENIAKEIIDNAISAATKDPRFEIITEDELDFLEVNVDVLSKPEEIDDESLLDPKKYGVIVTSGFKRGLLLPDLEGIDTVKEQIEIAMKKGNIYKDEKIRLERFTVDRHK